MRRPFLQLIGVCAVVLAVILLLKFTVTNQASSPAASADTPATKSAGIKTPWGEPDLQGIWTDEYQTPLQRPSTYAGREFFTDEERLLSMRNGRRSNFGLVRRGVPNVTSPVHTTKCTCPSSVPAAARL